MQLEGKGDQKLVAGAGIGIIFVSRFDLRGPLSLYQTVKFHNMGMIMNRLWRRRRRKVPVGQISQPRYPVLIAGKGLIFLGPGKVIKQFFQLVSPFL